MKPWNRIRLAVVLCACAALPATAQDAAESKLDKDTVIKVRALLSARKESEFKDYKKQLSDAKDLDWASVRDGLERGPYYQKPLATEFGELRSVGWGERYKRADDRQQAFNLYLPKSYDPKKKIPVLVYLHDRAGNTNYREGRGEVVVPRFAKLCEKHGFMLLAPSTYQGAEWWTPEGKKFVEWCLLTVRKRYSIDDDKIGVLGSWDGADGAWYLAQEMPDVFSCVLPLSGNPGRLARLVRPLYLGTLDRMDVLMGISGRNPGGRDMAWVRRSLQPMLKHGVRIQTLLYPRAGNDVSYFSRALPQGAAFFMDRKRKTFANEVDIDTDQDGVRSLWLAGGKIDPKGPVAANFNSTRYLGPELQKHKAEKRIGVGLSVRKKWAVGIVVNRSGGAAQQADIQAGDILLEMNGEKVKTTDDVKRIVRATKWGDEIEVLAAREITSDDRERMERKQRVYLKLRAKRLKAKKEGKDFLDIDDVEDDEDAGDEEDDGCSTLDTGDDDEDGCGDGCGDGDSSAATREFFIFRRWIPIRKSHGPFVRGDFGAGLDRNHREKGVKLGVVIANGHAWRSGLRTGDVITHIGGEEVNNARDVANFFGDFDFKEGVVFNYRRGSSEKDCEVDWSPKASGRVDAKWDKAERTMRVLIRKMDSFTLYFSEEMLKAGKPFHLFINGVPYQDLVNPSSAPDYPHPLPNDTDGYERLRKMRKKRAEVEGWKPDPHWAIDFYLKSRDRRLVFGASRTYDVSKFKEGFAAAKTRAEKRGQTRGERLDNAYRNRKPPE